MIRVPVDEAYGYDMLAIQRVKLGHLKREGEAATTVHNQLNEAIMEQVGEEKHVKIIRSAQYLALYRVNEEIFTALDDLKHEEWPGAARAIDWLNYQRYVAKRRLQHEFFSESPLTERKLGYVNAQEEITHGQ